MIKLVITDMDGTLLDDNHMINEEFWEVFDKLKEKGILFASASGRQYYNLLKNLKQIEDDVYFVAENGTYVVHRGEELFLNALPAEDAGKLIVRARRVEEADIVLCGKKAAYVESRNPKFIQEVEKYYEVYEVVDDLLAVEDDILKVTLCDFTGAEENSHPHFTEYESKYKVTVSGRIWLDIVNKDANKGVAVERLQKMLGIKPEETMAFGDYLNDVEMLEDAYYSYAMENAHPELKKAARFIAGSNNENGVVEKIKEMIL